MSNPYRMPSWRRHLFRCCTHKDGHQSCDREGNLKNVTNYQETTMKEHGEHHPRCIKDVFFTGSGLLRCQAQNDSSQPTNPLLSLKTQTEMLLKETRKTDVSKLLFNAARVLASMLQTDWFSLYLPSKNRTQLIEYECGGERKQYGPIGKGMTVSAEAAMLGFTVIVENLPQDAHYPNGTGHPEREVHSVLSIPLVLANDNFLGVIELCKDGLKEPFNENDLQISNSYLGWMLISLHQSKITRLIHLQSELNDFLLDSTQKIFDDMISIDTLMENILLFTKEIVNADRCAMFLVDEEREQLYAHYFEERSQNGKSVFSKKAQIRFSCDKGIAGHVYQTGEAVNVADAYDDARFNPDIDKQTGYRTKNILCMPVISKSRVIGVLEMVNSLSNDQFTPGDEDAFKTYAVYCALALHCSRLYSQLEKTKAHCKVAEEVQRRHMVYPKQGPQNLLESTPQEMIPSIFSEYDFNSYPYIEELPQMFIFMLHDLFGKATFDFPTLSRFILTVRKNYRAVPYHNWFHAMNVAHSLYMMSKNNPDKLSTHETMALVVAGVCHDLDHRGFGNIYFQEFNHPLSVLYRTSIMEEHHFYMTLTILGLDGHNIFSFLSPEENTNMLDMMHEAIIATDLSHVFENRNSVVDLLDNDSFDFKKYECRKRCKALMMTAADLCVIAKPFSVQKPTVSSMYQEFYKQGDEEKKIGITPPVMMDRNSADKLPSQQVGFIKFICVPLYTTLSVIMPGINPLLESARKSLATWEKIVADNDSENEEKSV